MRKPLRIIHSAVRSLLQHKLRACLSILGVICGVMAVMTMISIGEGAKQESLAQIEQLGTKNIYIRAITLTDVQEKKARDKRSPGLNGEDAVRIKNECPGVREVACLKELKASIMAAVKDISPQIVATSSNYAGVLRLFISRGRFLSDQDLILKNQVCVLGDTVAKQLGLQGQVGNLIRIENSLLKIVGTLHRFDRKIGKSGAVATRNYNEMLIVPLTVAGQFDALGLKKNEEKAVPLRELIVKIQSADQAIPLANIIRRIMEQAHGGAEDYQIVVPQELLRQAKKIQHIFNIVLGSIACISLLVGGIGIMNIMLATVSERTKEIGIRRSLGATREDIVIQFLTEAVLLTFTGGLIGILTGSLGVVIVASLADWPMAVTSLAILLPLMTSIFIGLFFGIYPAYLAARMDPVGALRYG